MLEVTAGRVFADLEGDLDRAREALACYPGDLWRYVLACDSTRLAQELPLRVARTRPLSSQPTTFANLPKARSRGSRAAQELDGQRGLPVQDVMS